MKQTIILGFMALFLSLLLVACGESNPTLSTDVETAPTESTSSETGENSPISTEVATETTPSPDDILDDAQRNSIAMLNYLAVLSQEINESKNSRMFLEEAYAALINNTNPEKVNELTESHLSSLLDIIEKYRMINVKRDRLQYIYEQNKAKAMKEAMPNPIALLSATQSWDWKRLAASAIYMAVDSYSSYQSYNNDISQEFLQDGWALDDEEAENLHDSRKRAFTFMVEIVREENLPGKLALNESAVERFVSWKNSTNNIQKIQFFESQLDTYQAFGDYWLELANCYYEAEDYKKCLEAIEKYENCQTDIFRKDYNFAQAIPKVIVAANECYEGEEYISVVERYLKLLLENTEVEEWALRYFASEMYLELYCKSNKSNYLDKAYEIALNNVNNLVKKQRELNAAYIAEVKEVSTPNDATKAEKKQIKEYNKSLHETRVTELSPVYEPLVLNCDLLFALAEERNITIEEKNRIDGILRGEDKWLFLSDILDNKYSFSAKDKKVEARLEKDQLVLPANCLNDGAVIKVTVINNGETTVYEDWGVKEVKRPSEDADKFTVTYTSKKFEKQQWSKDSTVKVEVFTDNLSETSFVAAQFKVSNFNGWWIFSDAVEFEQVA